MREDHRFDRARQYFRDGIEVKRRLIENCIPDLIAATDLIAAAFRSGHRLYIFGNGGSAADSQHMAAEFMNRLTMSFERPGLPAIALTTDTSFLTAFANDEGFEGVFARQLQCLGSPGDVVLGLSTSGDSLNVLRAIEFAKTNGMKAVALTGEGGQLARVADVSIEVPSKITTHIQEVHLAIEHVICHLVERELNGYEQGESR